jgi:hypothetical protein
LQLPAETCESLVTLRDQGASNFALVSGIAQLLF